jgi:pyrroloquinoline quinone biosynthesis protein D
MSALDPASKPRLASRARLQWDEQGQRHVLLFPEAALVLNPTAAETLKLCDGNRTVDAIVDDLASRFGQESRATIADHVIDLLARIRERGLLEI